jgi:hypothetical protein
MAEQLMPVKRTAATTADYVRAVLRAWHLVGDGVPSEQSIAVLYAQYIVETGGQSCWNWNFGNVKHVKGDGHDYQMLNGVWEGVTNDVATRLVASGEATLDTNASHHAAVGNGKVSVVFKPPHPATWFRAFATADEGMAEHLKTLAKRFSKAWPAVLAGDHAAFAKLLYEQRYFTASATVYASLMKRPFESLVASSTYEELVATMGAPVDAVAEEVAEPEAIRWDWEEYAGSGPVLHVMPTFPSYRDE